MEKILVIGAAGQLGTELTDTLAEKYGVENLLATDIKPLSEVDFRTAYVTLNVMDSEALASIVSEHQITQIYHLAAILSAKGESQPLSAWDLNMQSLLNVLELGKQQVKKIFWPSSIAVFGPDTPKDHTPQYTLMNPTTVYGISKLAGERWCEYYHQHYGVDVRSIRYPGLIGYKSLPGGGTTDYAVDVFFKAVQDEPFDCFLSEESYLPMMFMDDAVKATIDLMEAPTEDVKIRSSYNVSAISFSPAQIVSEIRKHRPELKVQYNPDYRQEIADTWPNSIDDTEARKDWGWQPHFDLSKMTEEILANLPAVLSRLHV